MKSHLIIIVAIATAVAGGLGVFTKTGRSTPQQTPAKAAEAPEAGNAAVPESPPLPLPEGAVGEPAELPADEQDDASPRPLRPEDVLEFEQLPDGSQRPRGPI
jgi:hypothetical protein